MALPRPSASRGLMAMSLRMSATIFSARDLLVSTFCMVPQRFLSSAFDRSVMFWVFASNHASTAWGESRCWSILRASYCRSTTTPSATASSNL
ncbi:Uncharacterised protein [Mycobacteroides abscessus subsp. abscessus]|nr:Uncharacterised protein [Mycobacteroides abscessus subsp. abscessus]